MSVQGFAYEEGYVHIGEDSISITGPDEEEVVYWHQDEWIEDPSVVLSIVNAVNILHEEGLEGIRRRIKPK